MKSEDWAKLVVETRELSGDSQEDFAKRLGITQQTVSLWEKGQLPRKNAVDKLEALNSYFRGYNDTKAILAAENGKENDEEENTTIPEALEMTETVLKSKTVYRSALMSNIKAFYKAVMGEEEMEKMHVRMDRMEQVNARLERKMDEMMRVMTGGLSEKREFKIA